MTTHRKFLCLLLLCVSITLFSQQRLTAEFGSPTTEDFALQSYSPNPDAAGVVLFESAKNYVDVVEDYVKLIKEVHVKIKVFNAAKFDQGTVLIPYYNVKNKSENIAKISAITHNGKLKSYLSEKNIYSTDETPKWSLKKFTFPDIQDGSILEYSYRIESNYFSTFDGWRFQGELPKIYSELHTKIPGNFSYHRVLHGGLELYINEAEIQKTCFTLPGYAVDADCEVATYAMRNVPAFKKENHMLSEDNYIARMHY
ncbi:DUF3857 domain-containing protein [Ulvibacter antarcticus]|uniref:DUF3857 domain-containing protein n=1 Tax=Ulvibacter antarcticus TaxID=442714 RepID=UPI000EFA1EE8|nr:DUF3857 domain-containing protein [Ulvibacter antarcticus]